MVKKQQALTMGEIIKAAFVRPDLVNRAALARAAGISPQRLAGYWHGERPWPADVALAILAAAGRVRWDRTRLIIATAETAIADD